MKKIIMITTTLLISVTMFGQVKFGIKAGGNASYFSEVKNYPTMGKGFGIGLHAGGYVNYSINDLWGVQAEALFSIQTGQAVETQKNPEIDIWMPNGHTVASFNYINIPLLLHCKPFKFPLSFVAGPQFGYCVSRWGVDKLPVDDSKYKNFDLAIACGAQYTFFNHLDVGLRYNLGLLPSYNIDYNQTFEDGVQGKGTVQSERTNILQLSVGWTF